MNRDRAYYVQFAILCVLALAFFDVTQFGVSKGRAPLLLAGVVAFPLATLIPLRLRPNSTAGREMIAVMFVAALPLFIPLSTEPPVQSRAAAAARLGLLVTEGLSALHRYHPIPESSAGGLITDASRAVGLGLRIAAGVP